MIDIDKLCIDGDFDSFKKLHEEHGSTRLCVKKDTLVYLFQVHREDIVNFIEEQMINGRENIFGAIYDYFHYNDFSTIISWLIESNGLYWHCRPPGTHKLFLPLFRAKRYDLLKRIISHETDNEDYHVLIYHIFNMSSKEEARELITNNIITARDLGYIAHAHMQDEEFIITMMDSVGDDSDSRWIIFKSSIEELSSIDILEIYPEFTKKHAKMIMEIVNKIDERKVKCDVIDHLIDNEYIEITPSLIWVLVMNSLFNHFCQGYEDNVKFLKSCRVTFRQLISQKHCSYQHISVMSKFVSINVDDVEHIASIETCEAIISQLGDGVENSAVERMLIKFPDLFTKLTVCKLVRYYDLLSSEMKEKVFEKNKDKTGLSWKSLLRRIKS